MDPQLLLSSLSLFIFFFSSLPVSDAAPARSPAARQFLPPQPGYIPVFIQDGETPPDVESIYEVLSQQSDGQDTVDPDPEMDLEENMALRESKDFIVQQLLSGVTTGSLRDNEVQQHKP